MLALLLQLLLDGEEPADVLAISTIAHCIVRPPWDIGKRLGDEGLFVLGLLFLADVELLGSGLALGEGIAGEMLALVSSVITNWHM